MSLVKYLQAIKNVDPGKIQVENVRSVLNTSRRSAEIICEYGVQEGVFEKRVGFICPNEGKIIADFPYYEKNLPEFLTCNTCENSDVEPCVFRITDLEYVKFYKLRL